MELFDVDFVEGDFNMAVKGPVADVFSDAEFMAARSSPLWGAGGLEGDSVDDNEQVGLNERDESTHYPVFMHLWAIYLPGGTRAALRSDAAQSRHRQRRLNQAATSKGDPAASTATAGKSQSAPSTRPNYPYDVFQ